MEIAQQSQKQTKEGGVPETDINGNTDKIIGRLELVYYDSYKEGWLILKTILINRECKDEGNQRHG